MLAPGTGQLILLAAPWPWVFYVLVIYAMVVAIWSVARLPETLPPESRSPLNLGTAFAAYKKVITTRVACGYVLASGVLFGGLFAFIFSVEQVMRVVFDQDDRLGLWFALVAGGIAVSNIANAMLVKRIGMRRLSHMAVITFTALGALNFLLMWQMGPVFPVFMIVMILIFGTVGMMGSNFNAIAMEPLGEIAGPRALRLGLQARRLRACLAI